jgi:hypothetical protein
MKQKEKEIRGIQSLDCDFGERVAGEELWIVREGHHETWVGEPLDKNMLPERRTSG